MIPCYALIDVKIGSVEIKARPVGWNGADYDGQGNNANGEPLEAIAFHTTCPNCGNLVHFMSQEIYKSPDGAENNITCSGCGAGAEKAKIQPRDAAKAWLKDPLADRTFSDEIVDLELLAKLDEELFA